MKKIQKPIGILLLAVFIFTFLHSELGFLTYDHDHSHHDHCTIVNGSTAPSNNTSSAKIKIDFNFILKSIIDEQINSQIFYSNFKEIIFIRENNKVYLQNQTFLI